MTNLVFFLALLSTSVSVTTALDTDDQPRSLQSSSYYSSAIPVDDVISSLGPRGPKTQRAMIGTAVGFLFVLLLLVIIHIRTRKRVIAALNNTPANDLPDPTLPAPVPMYTLPNAGNTTRNNGINGESKDNDEESSSPPVVTTTTVSPGVAVPTAQRPDILALKRISPKMVAVGVLNLLIWIFGMSATYAPWGGKWYTATVQGQSYDVEVLMTLFNGHVCTRSTAYSYYYYYYTNCDFGTIAEMYEGYPESYSDLSSSQLAVTTAHFATWLAFVIAVIAFLTHREIRRKWTIAFRGPHVRADCCISPDHPVCPDCCGLDYERNGPMPGRYRCSDSSDSGPKDTACSSNRLHTNVCNLRTVYILNAVTLVLWIITWSSGMTPFVYSNNGTRTGGNLMQLQGGFAMAIVCFIFVFLTTLIAGVALRDGLDNNALITGIYSLADLSVGGTPSLLSITGSPSATGPQSGAPVPASVPFMFPPTYGMPASTMPRTPPNTNNGMYYPGANPSPNNNTTNMVYPTSYPVYYPGTSVPTPYPSTTGSYPVPPNGMVPNMHPYSNPMMPYGVPMNPPTNPHNPNDDNPSSLNPDVPRKTMTTIPQAAVLGNTVGNGMMPGIYPPNYGRTMMGNSNVPVPNATMTMNNTTGTMTTTVPPGYMLINVPGPNGQPTQAMVPVQYASSMMNNLPVNSNGNNPSNNGPIV